MDTIEQTMAVKKTWQKPNFWIIDSCIEGGVGANVNEATARTKNFGAQAQQGTGIEVYRAGNYAAAHSANWTAAHS